MIYMIKQETTQQSKTDSKLPV